MFFIQDGLQIHVNNFDMNITPFGLYVLYATFTMFLIFVNIYYIIKLKLNRNKQQAKFIRFLNEFNEIKKNRNAHNDISIDMPSHREAVINDSEPSIANTVEDANYEQLRLLFSN